jgi:hypothetical protein
MTHSKPIPLEARKLEEMIEHNLHCAMVELEQGKRREYLYAVDNYAREYKKITGKHYVASCIRSKGWGKEE